MHFLHPLCVGVFIEKCVCVCFKMDVKTGFPFNLFWIALDYLSSECFINEVWSCFPKTGSIYLLLFETEKNCS